MCVNTKGGLRLKQPDVNKKGLVPDLKKSDWKQLLRCYATITVGCLIFSLSFDWFFAPNVVGVGGVTGLSQIIHHLFPKLTIGTLEILLNIPLFVAGWIFIGFHLLASSVFSMLVTSVSIDLFAALISFQPMDPMLASIVGGAMMGLGMGIVFIEGATTGGSDIIARLLKLKLPWLPVGNLILVPDFMILSLVALTFHKVEAALYGLIALYVSSKVLDLVLYGMDTSKVAYIITDNWQETSDAILSLERGVTILHAQGAFTGNEKRVLMVAFKQKEIVEIRKTVHAADPNAFCIVCDTHEVLGEGFGEFQKENI